jgi:hypothetical protein
MMGYPEADLLDDLFGTDTALEYGAPFSMDGNYDMPMYPNGPH